MQAFLRAFLHMDRRWIYLMVAAAMCLPLAHPFHFPGLSVTPQVQALHDRIEKMPAGSNLLLSFDFDPSSKAELEPQARAILRHAFKRHLTVFAMGLWPSGWGMSQRIVQESADRAKAKDGQDYVLLGSQVGGSAIILGMGQDLAKTFPKDVRGRPVQDIPAMKSVKTLKDFHLIISLGAGDPGPEAWVVFGGDRHKVPLAAGTVSVNAAILQPYVQGRQILALVPGMKGAAEYEMLMKEEGAATKGMDSLSLASFLLIGLVLVANVAYLMGRRT